MVSLSSCKYSPDKLTPIFPDFSKQTVNMWKVKQVQPLQFDVAEQGVPFSEIDRRVLNKELVPLVCFPIDQAQEMKRAWESENRKNAIDN